MFVSFFFSEIRLLVVVKRLSKKVSDSKSHCFFVSDRGGEGVFFRYDSNSKCNNLWRGKEKGRGWAAGRDSRRWFGLDRGLLCESLLQGARLEGLRLGVELHRWPLPLQLEPPGAVRTNGLPGNVHWLLGRAYRGGWRLWLA